MLLQTLKTDQLAARKNRDITKSTILTTLIGEAAMVGKNNGNRDSVDSEVLDVIRKFIKNIDETLLVRYSETLETEKSILMTYVPVQFSREELEIFIEDIIISGTSPNVGTVMKVLKEKHNGKYNGQLASTIAKEILGL